MAEDTWGWSSGAGWRAQFREDTPLVALTDESEERLRALRRGLRRADWFTLFVVLASDTARAEVVEGVKPGETVVAVSGSFVRDGDKVAPVPAKPAAGEGSMSA